MVLAIVSLSLILSQPPAPLTGAWVGTSLCLQGKPTCKDEQVVYHIASVGADSITIQANKVVNGVEEEMGLLRCGVTATRVTCPMPPQFRPGTWWFDRKGSVLDGGLTVPGGGEFRKVHVVRRG